MRDIKTLIGMLEDLKTKLKKYKEDDSGTYSFYEDLQYHLNSIPMQLPVILPEPNQPIFTIREVERMLADQRLSCMKQRYYYRYKGVKKMEEAILNAPPPQEFIDKTIVKIP